jgi:hypothetical protein
MGLFNGKEVNELVTKTGENTNEIIAVKRDIEKNTCEIESIKIEYEKRFKLLSDEILKIRNVSNDKIAVFEKERDEAKIALQEELESQKIKGENLTFHDVCNIANISGLKTADLKFYLCENDIMSMNINKAKNSFSLKINSVDDLHSELMNYLVIHKGKLLFKQNIVEYIEKYRQNIIDSIDRYHAKQEQYKKSAKNLASRNVENYKEEIKMICGTDTNVKWNAIYKIFSNTYKTFYNDWNKYKTEHHVDGRYDIPMVDYVVSIMGEGNYLLKIACDLYA